MGYLSKFNTENEDHSDTCKDSLEIPLQLESKLLREDTGFDRICFCFSDNCNTKRFYKRLRQRNLELEYQSGVFSEGIRAHP
jgi:hypothetical protein